MLLLLLRAALPLSKPTLFIHLSANNHEWTQACHRPDPGLLGTHLGLDIRVLTPSWLTWSDGLWGPHRLVE